MHARLIELATRQSSKPSSRLDNSLDLAHARLASASRRSKRYNHLRKVSEESLKSLAASFGLETWADEPVNGIQILSITGKIIVVDIGLEISTNAVKSCTLVLASEDGLQDEITVDGRDTMFFDLAAGRLDSFSRNLEKLAFLDKYSDPAIGLSLFQVQDSLREALNRKSRDNRPGCLTESVTGSSHLDMPLTYHISHQSLPKDGTPQMATSHLKSPYKVFLEIGEQPVSARFDRATVESFSMDDVPRKPVLRYPKVWLDSSGNWISLKQLSTTRFVADLRYSVAFDPPITVPESVVHDLAQSFPPRVETDIMPREAHLNRSLYTPEGTRNFRIAYQSLEPLRALRSVAFSHPKEVEHILSIAKQFAICQQLTSSLGASKSPSDVAFSSIRITVGLVTDVVTTIDNRRSIMLAVFDSPDQDQSDPDATVVIQPNANRKCWHRHNEQAFMKAIETTEDLLLSHHYANGASTR